VETHSLKTTRTRAWADYDIMRHTIDIVSKDPQALRKAVREADRVFSAQAGDRSAPAVYLGQGQRNAERAAGVSRIEAGPYKSAVTGATVNG